MTTHDLVRTNSITPTVTYLYIKRSNHTPTHVTLKYRGISRPSVLTGDDLHVAITPAVTARHRTHDSAERANLHARMRPTTTRALISRTSGFHSARANSSAPPNAVDLIPDLRRSRANRLPSSLISHYCGGKLSPHAPLNWTDSRV